MVICVVDNAGDPLLREHIAQRGWRYVCTGVNHGYGKGHNLALSTLADVDAPYHLVVNPDISFSAEGMLRMLDYMDEQPDVGQLMPRIIYPDGRLQHLCKLLPAPSDLLLRRFFARLRAQTALARSVRTAALVLRRSSGYPGLVRLFHGAAARGIAAMRRL